MDYAPSKVLREYQGLSTGMIIRTRSNRAGYVIQRISGPFHALTTSDMIKIYLTKLGEPLEVVLLACSFPGKPFKYGKNDTLYLPEVYHWPENDTWWMITGRRLYIAGRQADFANSFQMRFSGIFHEPQTLNFHPYEFTQEVQYPEATRFHEARAFKCPVCSQDFNGEPVLVPGQAPRVQAPKSPCCQARGVPIFIIRSQAH